MRAGPLAGLAEEIVRKAVARGARDAEAFVRSSESLRIEVKDRAIEGVRRTREVSAALRVLVDGRPGFSYATDPTPSTIALMAERAVGSARLGPPSPMERFAPASRPGPAPGVLDRDGLEAAFEAKAAMAMELEAASLNAHPSVTKVRKPSYSQLSRATAIHCAQGTWTNEDSVFSLEVEAVAEAGPESQIAYDYQVSRRMADLDPASTGERAGREAAGRLGAQVPRSGLLPALFVPRMSVELLGILLPSFSAHEMQKGRSRLAGRRGERVFSDLVTIVDDGSMPGGVGTVPFDDEGVAPKPRRLVEGGCLLGCLHTLLTAARQKEEPTGNGFRAGVGAGSIPSPSPTNLFLQPGNAPLGDALPRDTVLRVEFLLGSHTADRVTGDFSMGAAGSVLEGGERAGAFGGGTISGNIFDLFSGLAAVGDDLVFQGSLGAPSILAGSVIVSGK